MNPFDPHGSGLLTDLHELTAVAACWKRGHNPRATFELSLRQLPPNRGYLVAAGMEQIAHYLLDLSFTPEDVQFLRNLFVFHNIEPEFWEMLERFQFSGDLRMVPEGTPFFPGEPIVQITAPLIDAQLVGCYVASMASYATLVATRTARLVQAAGGRQVVEMATGAAASGTASVIAARAAYIAGAAGTTNLEAARSTGVPIHTTMPRSFVLAFADEMEAFQAQLEAYPTSASVILDTRDPLAAARLVAAAPATIRSVRIDSGDLGQLAREVRGLLDAGGKQKVKILASGALDEQAIADLVAADAPIDTFYVGAELCQPSDSSHVDLGYDLVELTLEGAEPTPRFQTTPGKATLPGKKQVYRRFAADGPAKSDLVALDGEKTTGAPMLLDVLTAGKPAAGRPGVETSRSYTARAVARLSPAVRDLLSPAPYPVAFSEPLQSLAAEVGAVAPDGDSSPTQPPGDR